LVTVYFEKEFSLTFLQQVGMKSSATINNLDFKQKRTCSFAISDKLASSVIPRFLGICRHCNYCTEILLSGS
jgi:hypothetical protein